MGLKPSNGMGLSSDDSYFHFNEYERKRKYLQMGSCKPGVPKPRPQLKAAVNNNKSNKTDKKIVPQNSKTNAAPVKAAEVHEPKATTSFQARQKWGAAAAAVNAAAAFNNVKKKGGAKYTAEPAAPPPPPSGPFENGQTVGSMKRTISLFEQLIYT